MAWSMLAIIIHMLSVRQEVLVPYLHFADCPLV